MRGFPLANALLTAGCLLVFLLPLATLTGQQKRGVLPPAETGGADEHIPTRIILKFAHIPLRAEVSHLGKQLWAADRFGEGGTEFEVSLPLSRASDGIDLLVEVLWPGEVPQTVVQVVLEPEGLGQVSQTAWGRGEFAEVLGFVWPGEQP